MEEVKKEELKEILTVNIKKEGFTFNVRNILISSFIAIETEKQRLTSGKYFDLAKTYFIDTQNVVSVINMIAIFRVLNPKIEKGLGGVEFENLSIMDVRELLKIFIEEVQPWYVGWMNEFNNPFEDDGKD